MKKKALLSSILVIALCFSVIVGSTLALFTTQDELNIAVTSAQVKLTANIRGNTLQTWSDPFKNNPYYSSEYTVRNGVEISNGVYYSPFDNGGDAKVTDLGTAGVAQVVITKMTPGDVVKFTVDVENQSNVNVQYRVIMRSYAPTTAGTPDLTDVLVTTAYIDGALYEMSEYKGNDKITPWRFIDKDMPIEDFDITIAFPDDNESIDENGMLNHNNRDNQYQNGEAYIEFIVEAVQANGVPFESTNNVDDLVGGYLYGDKVIGDGAYNGEGDSYDITDPALCVGEFLSLANMTLNAEGTIGALYTDSDYSDNSTIILADNANINVGANKTAIRIHRGQYSVDTLVLDENARINCEVGSAAVLAQYGEQGGEFNLVLNGRNCITGITEDAFGFAGAPANKAQINILVNSVEDMNYYKTLVDSGCHDVIIQWYVDGVEYGAPIVK